MPLPSVLGGNDLPSPPLPSPFSPTSYDLLSIFLLIPLFQCRPLCYIHVQTLLLSFFTAYSFFDIILGVSIVVLLVSSVLPFTSFLSPPFSPLRPFCLPRSPLYFLLVSPVSPLRPSCLPVLPFTSFLSPRSPLYVLLVSSVLPFYVPSSISLSPNLPGPHFSPPVSSSCRSS
jgi:hypothetical protein